MIIQRIEKKLAEKDLMQKDLAHFIGVGPSTVGNWISRGTDPPARYLIHICDFLDVSLEYLLTGKEENTVEQIGSNADLCTDEADLLSYFRVLSRRNQRAILVQMENMINQENEQAATKQGKYLAQSGT